MEEQKMAKWLTGFTLPLKLSMINPTSTKSMEVTVRMDMTVFDHEAFKTWPTALHYVRHYTDETQSAKDAMRLLAIDSGCLENSTLWQILGRHPGFLKDAGLTPEQIEFRDCVSSLRVPLTFTLTGKDKKEHRIVLRENHLFSSKHDDGLSALDVCHIFKDWKLDTELAKDSLNVLYYTGDDGTEWSLSEILDRSPFLQTCVPDKPTDLAIAAEAKRYLELAGQYTHMEARVHVMEEFMKFLEDDCFDFIMRHSMFRQMVLEKCDVIIASHAKEYPALVAVCKDLLATWEPTR